MKQGQQAWGHGKGKQARHGMAKQGRCSKQPADEVAGTGLVANSQQTIRPAQTLQ